MTHLTRRRDFLAQSGAALAGLTLCSTAAEVANAKKREKKNRKAPFKISIAQWSLHKSLFAGKMDNLDFGKVSAEEFGINAIEYVNQFFKDKARDQEYLKEMKTRNDDLGVETLLIMCDGEGRLGDPDDAKRKQAVENHFKWVEATKYLGGHSIRVNAASAGEYEEQRKLAADGLRRLSEFAADFGLNVIVENHGGLSSNGKWLSTVIKDVGLKNCGTLPDFGNFHDYDRYLGVEELMPHAKAVSAKSHDFDANGNETRTDYFKIMKIVLDHGYNGYVGVEYEGSKLPEFDGILATKRLLERVAAQS
ncbi:MAG: sugar phosphate isomerase/epimerase family protein [Pirellulaceae bacterium]